jgi:hypothetical protein
MDRRRFLKTGVVLSSASVAGCTGNMLSGGQQSTFEDISRQGTDLIVNLNPNANIQQVNLITPDGTQATSTQLAAGESQAVLSLLNRSFAQIKYVYTPGTNTLVAIGENGNEHEQEMSLRPRLSATSISLLQDRKSNTYAGYERHTDPVVTVENTGSAPALIIESAVRGASVPTSERLPDGSLTLNREGLSADLEQLGRNESLDPSLQNRGTQSIVTIPPDASIQVITTYHPLGFTTTAGSMGKQTKQRLEERWGGQTITATAILAERTGRLKVSFSARFGGTPQAAITGGRELLYFENTQITTSSATSST